MLIDAIEELLGPYFPYEATTNLAFVLGFSFLVAVAATAYVMPKLIHKLKGAGITGTDINKPDPKPEIPEMGGLGWLLGLYSGVFAALIVFQNGTTPGSQLLGDPGSTRLFISAHGAQLIILYLATLLTITGAAMAGILDDLIQLRQRFKAAISFVFAAPLMIFVSDYTIWFPLLGAVDFGILYPLILVPLGVASAAQSMNMLEGFNGLSAGNCLIIALGLVAVSLITGNDDGLVLLAPFIGATLVFLFYNIYPAKVFPGDVFTLAAGAYLAAVAIVGKMELAGLIMFTPQIVEFFLKMRSSFSAENFATGIDADGKLHYKGKPDSLTHAMMKWYDGLEENRFVGLIWGVQLGAVLLAIAIIVLLPIFST